MEIATQYEMAFSHALNLKKAHVKIFDFFTCLKLDLRKVEVN